MSEHDKIFGIGIGRTASKSLAYALEILGYNTFHCAPDEATTAEVLSGAKISRITEKREAIIDTILPLLHYQEYAIRFPNAKFILTTRDTKSWLQSMRRHMMHMRLVYPTNYSTHLYGSLILKGWTTGATGDQKLLNTFYQHNQTVRDFFSDKPGRLLEMDIANGDGWEKLCPFLGKEIPACNFPTVNSMPKNTSTFGCGDAIIEKDKLALATMITPAYKIDHLHEWIQWHYQLGVRHFWIVCDSPAGNMHDKAVDSIHQKIEDIIPKCELTMPYINLRVNDFADFSSASVESQKQRQNIVAHNVAKIAEELVQWFALIDIDEMLYMDVIDRLEQIKIDKTNSTIIPVDSQRVLKKRAGGKNQLSSIESFGLEYSATATATAPKAIAFRHFHELSWSRSKKI